MMTGGWVWFLNVSPEFHKLYGTQVERAFFLTVQKGKLALACGLENDEILILNAGIFQGISRKRKRC